jgi:hypothetical protein
MLYGYTKDDNVLVVTAIDRNTKEIFDLWYEENKTDPRIVDERRTNVMDKWDDEFARMRHHVIIFDFENIDSLKAFALEKDIVLLGNNQAYDFHQDMVEYELPTFLEAYGDQTIAEIHGLTEVDPWDRRTDEEKAMTAEEKKELEKLRGAHQITDESFVPPPSRDKTNVTDVRTSTDANGNITIDNVLAKKWTKEEIDDYRKNVQGIDTDNPTE